MQDKRPLRILVISALQEELDPLWYHSNLAWSDLEENVDAVLYLHSTCGGYELISACAGEVGLTATTILLTKLILRWKPVLVLMIGSLAGKKALGLEIGD